ncbi:MAG: hypothetical protein PHF86_05930 [Candidatus Nanoarchaeia archaeon]|nr:hypothetical protein [Candidatus Nanoarchaeia archaeon]
MSKDKPSSELGPVNLVGKLSPVELVNQLGPVDLMNQISTNNLSKGCEDIPWLRELYNSYTESSMSESNKKGINENEQTFTPKILFQYNPNKFLDNFEQIYLPTLIDFHPGSDFGPKEKLLEISYDAIYTIFTYFDKMSKNIMVSSLNELPTIKKRLEQAHHKLKLIRIKANSYMNIDEGFLSKSSLSEITQDKDTLEVIIAQEVIPLIKLFNGKIINKDHLKVELSNIIERYNIDGVNDNTFLEDLYHQLKRGLNTQYLQDFGILYSELAKNNEIEKIQIMNENIGKLINQMSKLNISIEFLDSGFYTGFFPQAFSELIKLFNIACSNIAFKDTKKYSMILNHLSTLFDSPKDFGDMIKGCENLKRNKVALVDELRYSKVNLDGKIVSYESMFKKILNKLREN